MSFLIFERYLFDEQSSDNNYLPVPEYEFIQNLFYSWAYL